LLTTPHISVILSVFNGGSFLVESVESVLNQRYTDFEFLIMDDCSTDESLSYLNSIRDERVRIFRQEKNRSLFPCLNELIAYSKGELIKIWSQDDIMYPRCLGVTAAFHKEHPGIGFSYSGRDTIDERGVLKPNSHVDKTPDIISPELHARIAFYTGSIAGNIANVCINKSALEKVGLFHEDMTIVADFDMWVRLARYYDTGFIREPLVQLRDHKNQLSRNRNYFIRRPIEDMHVFNYLVSYVPEDIKKEGLLNLRKYKFVYYYTLMVKAVLRGKLSIHLEISGH